MGTGFDDVSVEKTMLPGQNLRMSPRLSPRDAAPTASREHRSSGSLAGGFCPGDRVVSSKGAMATVVGPPARRACQAISVAVRFDNTGRQEDERVAGMELQA